MFTDLRQWLAVAGFALAGLAGLFIAAHGESGNHYTFGLGLFAAAVVGIAFLVRRALDAADAGR